MADRNDVLALLYVAGKSGATCNITPDLLAELCKTWLAVADAPEGVVSYGADHGRAQPSQIIHAKGMPLKPGQRIRLVPFDEDK